jgi:hypothetical protein
MKKSIWISTVAALLLVSFTGLQANEVLGEAAAKAKVEEVAKKEAFKAKMDRETFEKEAKEDVQKVDATEKVKEIEAEDKKDAIKESNQFKKDASADKKKILK